jgi:hypothetical protein
MVAGGRFGLLAKRPPETGPNGTRTPQGCQNQEILTDVSPGIFLVAMREGCSHSKTLLQTPRPRVLRHLAFPRPLLFRAFPHLDFEFVSDFGFREPIAELEDSRQSTSANPCSSESLRLLRFFAATFAIASRISDLPPMVRSPLVSSPLSPHPHFSFQNSSFCPCTPHSPLRNPHSPLRTRNARFSCKLAAPPLLSAITRTTVI